jgi:hypothetical protein
VLEIILADLADGIVGLGLGNFKEVKAFPGIPHERQNSTPVPRIR